LNTKFFEFLRFYPDLFSEECQSLIVFDTEKKVRYYSVNGLDPEIDPNSRGQIGKTLDDLPWPKMQVELIEMAMAEAIMREETVKSEFSLLQNEKQFHFSVRVNVIFDEGRKPECWLVRIFDETVKNQSEKQVKHLEGLLKNVHEISIILDTKGNILWWNDAFLAHTGLVDLKIAETRLSDFFGPEMPRHEKEKFEKALADCVVSQFVLSKSAGAEPHFKIHINILPVFNEIGHCVQFVCSGREISKDLMEQAAKETLITLLEDTNREAGIGGWSFEPQSDRIFWSKEVFSIHELDDFQIPTVKEVISFFEGEEARNQYFQAGANALQFGIPYDLNLPLRTAKGKLIHVRVRGIPEMEDGHCIRLYGSIQRVMKMEPVSVN
jgi:PAS domain S-box-containing protein